MTDSTNDMAVNEYKKIRIGKLEKLESLGHNPYPEKFSVDIKAKELHSKYQDLQNGEVTEDTYQIAGRVISHRNDGMFIDILDETDQIQVFCHKNQLSDEYIQIIQLIDISDIVGFRGIIRRTPRGELTLNASEVYMLAKSFAPLPEKYHGLTDVETRYRKRHLDLITNPNSKNVLIMRSMIITSIRNFLVENGFLEVETPMLHPIAGGAIAKPFVTYHNSLDMDFYLRIAPELYLKKLIIGGLSDKVFEINRCFRNEGISIKHNPEFTSLELYQSYASYEDGIKLLEDLVRYVANNIFNKYTFTYKDVEINFENSWVKKSMCELVLEHCGIDFIQLDQAQAYAAAKDIHIPVGKDDSWGKIVEKCFAEKVEHTLIQPTHIIDIPSDISPLAKKNPQDPRLSLRFETYVNGWEISNAYSELNDPMEQLATFKAQLELKEQGDDEAHDIDYDYIEALEQAMPPTLGLGLGLDRLIMLLTDSHSIREVILFPTLKKQL